MDCTEVPAGSLRHLNSHAHTIWGGPGRQDDAMALIPLVEPLHNRPQGEMVRALCDSLIPVFRERSQTRHELISEVFSDLLTRNGVGPLILSEAAMLIVDLGMY